jgi:putative transposase
VASGGTEDPAEAAESGPPVADDSSCVRLRPERPNHVWYYDFVHDRTHDGRSIRMLTMIDEFARDSLAIRVGWRLCSEDVLDLLTELFAERGTPEYLRSDNRPGMTAIAVREWLDRAGGRRSSSSRAVRGRTATWRAWAGDCATSYWAARSSTH